MKANEFVKKHGLERSVELLAECPVDYEFIGKCGFSKVQWDDFVYKGELERLVESHELVESKGGLIKAKEILADNPVWCSGLKRYSSPLERAIADVESCMEVS